jgi:hypothetical protein
MPAAYKGTTLMKNVILGLALVGFAFGCKSNSSSAVADPANAKMPKAECGASKECSSEAKAECASKKACCSEKAAPQN